jgi:hypothetical protein
MAIEETLRPQLETYLAQLDALMRRGRELRETLAADSYNSSTKSIAAARSWQEDCGVAINQLSGGSKAHWLARSFSEAFLKRSADGRAAEGAALAEIVTRLLNVLGEAAAALNGMDNGPSPVSSTTSSQAPAPHQFDFVHNPELRPVVEQAYIDSRQAFEQADYGSALRTSCGILEAIVTDALEHKGLGALGVSGAPSGKISDWPFATRLAVAERAGLIRGGCARLPAVARVYRDQPDTEGESISNAAVSEREARVTGQVLRVVMRDLDPGR